MVQKARSMVRKLDIASDGRSLWPAGGNDAGLPSPTSPLDRAAPSPRVWRHRDAGGVGLAILAALEGQPGSPAARVSTPIAIASPRRAAGHGRLEVSELGCSGRCATSFCGGASVSDGAAFRVADFLASCHLCRRRLDGKDIYMYRGEKAFCSMECRYQQIVSDEYQEKDKRAVPEMPSKAAAAAEIAGSPYAGGQIFFTGIVAA